jgi:hypothetical protein
MAKAIKLINEKQRFGSAIVIMEISFLKAHRRWAFKKLILVFLAPKALETLKSVSD